MRVNRGLLGWGVFFLALGGVPLAVRGGLIDAATAARAWELWPLLLVGAGLTLALRRTGAEAVGGMLAALTLGLMAGGLIAGGVSGMNPLTLCGTSGGRPAGPNGTPVTGSLGAEASVDLTVNCGTLSSVTQPGSGWSIVWPAASNSAPRVLQATDSRLEVDLGRDHGVGLGDPAAYWDLSLPADPKVALSVSVSAGSATLAFGGAHVTSASASANAGSLHLDLGGAVGTTSVSASANAGSVSLVLPTPDGTLSGSMSANAGSVDICTPAGIPLRIETGSSNLGSINLKDRGLTQNGNIWTRGDWASATARIDLRVSVNLGSVNLDPEAGCG